MSNVHIRTVEDARGDLVDLVYYHHGCAPADVPGWPAPEAIDYPVYCAECGERVEEVPLTDAGREYEEESLGSLKARLQAARSFGVPFDQPSKRRHS
jgi:hypothetical protein